MSGAERQKQSEREPPRFAVSADGYVRLTPTAFKAIPLVHLFSELDPDAVKTVEASAGASASSIAGFTEWASQSMPALSLGWDWRLSTSSVPPRYERDGEVRGNIMFVDARRCDYGVVGTDALLREAIDALDWRKVVADYITRRYA